MEGKELQHSFHNHMLTLKVEQTWRGKGVKCNGCSMLISGPFYSCGECKYFLHKICAELPTELDYPLHPEHPLVLLECSPYRNNYICDSCGEIGSQFVYHCSECSFDLDMTCASATHKIKDKCHPHPLTPSQDPIAFPCHICLVEEKSPSYKCTICPFVVHQNCTLIPNTVKHSYHDHLLKLFPSIPFEFRKVSKSCDICYSKLFMFQCIYSCVSCMFFSHVSCAISETMQSPSTSRDQDTDGQSLMCLPIKQNSTDFISHLVRNYTKGDADKDDKIDHFNHEHPLFPIDEYTTDKTCEVCAIRISDPSYGCVECDYFLHKCCTDLPKQICHPAHPEHQLILQDRPDCIYCSLCNQYCNSFTYDCSDCEDFSLDIRCALIQGTVYHEAHKHHLSLVPVANSAMTCTACGFKPYYKYILKCNTCWFVLCCRCAMAPRVIKHRYGKSEPFKLKYSPFENHDDEYICEICLNELNPKEWYYHCVYADQFAHTWCMRWAGACSNIKYGKSHMFYDRHEHKLTMISCTYDCNRCNECGEPMRRNMCEGIGLECIPCNFRVHLFCRNLIDEI